MIFGLTVAQHMYFLKSDSNTRQNGSVGSFPYIDYNDEEDANVLTY